MSALCANVLKAFCKKLLSQLRFVANALYTEESHTLNYCILFLKLLASIVFLLLFKWGYQFQTRHTFVCVLSVN